MDVKFLIDSGSPVTAVTMESWGKIKREAKAGRAQIFKWTDGGTKELRAFATRDPLTVIGSFWAKIEVIGHEKPTKKEEIFVVKGAKRSLLGAEAAKEMKLLRVGVEVNQVTDGESCETIKSPERFPSIPNLVLSFDVDDSVPPKKDFRYSIPQSLEASLNEELGKLEKQQIIEPAPTTPTWVSRLKAVTKANGEIRWVVTMLGPNKAIRRVYDPMPSMDKLAVKMAGAKWFTKLDIKKAFFHVELDEKAKEMTTFMTSKGPMRFTRLAFGVNCAPEAFQKIMEDILRGCEGTVVFIDDILVFGESRTELEDRTKTVESRLKSNNLTLNAEKCKYGQSEVEFLGYIVSEKGMRPAKDKVKDVLSCKRPSSVTGVKSFLGMVNFMGSFIPDLSEISEPLRRISGSTRTFEWGQEQETAFEKMKEIVAKEVHTRGFFNENDITWLYTDASPVGLGAVLIQERESGEKVPIGFASKALSATEAKYPQTQREALAVVWGVERFHYYLIGREFHLVVDHQPLAFIFEGSSQGDKRATTRAESYALRLSTYRFKIHVVRGEENIADYLSRESLENNEEFEEGRGAHEIGSLTVTVDPEFRKGLQSVTLEEIAKANEADEVFAKVKQAIKCDNWEKDLQRYAAFKDELSIQNGILLRNDKIIPPQALRNRLLRIAHLGHPGIVSMKRSIRNALWWPNLDSDVENAVRQCEGCTRVARNDPPEPMSRSVMPEEPWEYLAMDFFSAPSLGVKLLVLVDYFSRLIVVRKMKETDAGKVCDQLEDIFVTYGYPECLRADNGPPFTSKELQEWCNRRSISLVHSTPWAPWMNGEVEAQMKGIGKELKIVVGTKQNWERGLAEYVYAYNRRVHPTTNEKPVDL